MTDEDQDSGSDQIYVLTSNKSQEVKRKLFASLMLGQSTIRFLLDCGATVNLLSEEIAKKALGSEYKMRPAQSNLRMYDKTELKTVGMITATVINPKTNEQHAVDFYITKNHNDPILGSEACQRLKFLTVNLERILALDDTKRVTVKTQEDVNKQFSDLFQGIGKLEGKLHLVVDPSVPPVRVPLRKLPVPIKEKVRAELLSMVESGIIEPVNEPSEWISALVVVAKANGGIRLCVDTKPLNKALKRNHYLMPTLEDILPELQDAKVFTTCDVSKAFYHVQLDDESKKLTTFESPFGRFRFLRMAFGLSVSPEEWMRRLHEVLYGLKGVACIADDILVYGCGKTLEEANADHDENLTALLIRCRESGIRLNKEKFKYKRDSVAYMGHELTRTGLQIDLNKVKAIREMPAPVDKKGVQRLLGVATYLSRYAPVFSQQTATLRSLLESKNEFRWDEEIHGKAFEQLKLTFENAPVLSYFDVNKEITVQCDASQDGLGACLLQEGKPIAFVSRALSASEKSYAQIEKELLAIVFAMERFHTYVFGSSIKIETDHKPLLTIVKKALTSAPKRLQRMLLRLQNYDFELIYRPGTQLVLADTLSRAYLPRADTRGSASELFSEDIAALQDEDKNDYIVASEYVQDLIKKAIETDDHYKALKHQIHTGWPERAKNVSKELQQYLPYCDELIVENGLIFKGTSLFVPQAIRQEMVERAHMSHAGINSSIRRARDAVYWPNMNSEITKHISKCEICQRIASESQKEPMILRELATRPWQFVATDLFEFRQQSYLITVDYFSNYFEIDRLEEKKAKDVIRCLKKHFSAYGIPERVFSDFGPPYNSSDFRDFAKIYEFKHVISSPTYSQSNGKAESGVKIAKMLMKKSVEAGTDFNICLLNWRNIPNENLLLSPVQILMGRRTRTLLPMSSKKLDTPESKTVNLRSALAQEKQAKYYDRGSRLKPTLSVGETVRARLHTNRDWEKGQVVKVLPFRSYIVKNEDDREFRRNSRHVRFTTEPALELKEVADPEMNSGIMKNNELLTSRQTSRETERHNTTEIKSKSGLQVAPGRENGLTESITINNQNAATATPVKTRSGRVIKLPQRFKD